MIEHIEELGAVLQSPSLPDRERLVSGEVDVECSRPLQDVAPGIAERPEPGGGERRCVEPFRDAVAASAAGLRRLLHHVRQIVADTGQSAILAGSDSQWKSTLPVPDGRGLPSSQQRLTDALLGRR